MTRVFLMALKIRTLYIVVNSKEVLSICYVRFWEEMGLLENNLIVIRLANSGMITGTISPNIS